MLTIKTIQVKNFRSIADETFTLPGFTVLVGKNDAGKSNLLQALRVLLEGTAASINSEDFYDPASPIEILATFHGMSDYLGLCDEKNRKKIADRIDAEGLFRIRRIAPPTLKLGPIETFDPNSGQFGTPTGIDAAIKPILPEVISIEALADVADETKGTKKDALGQLVGQVISRITEQLQPSLDQAYEQANRLLNAPGADPRTDPQEDRRVPDLIAIEQEMTRYLQETFAAASVRLGVRLPQVQEILARMDVSIKERGHEDPYYRRGQGLQRTLYLSLFRALAARSRQPQIDVPTRPFILLFEEPEAFLHPEGQVKMSHALAMVATENQVIIATHSPLMVTPESILSTIRIERRPESGYLKPVSRRFGPIAAQDLTVPQRQLLSLFAIQRSSKFLFSRGVLLVEGVGDEHIFSAVGARLRGFDPEANEISIVEAGGKDSLEPFAELLRMLGLQVWALADLDYLWRGAGALVGTDPAYGRFMQRLQELVPGPEPTDDAAKRERKRQRSEACNTTLAAERDALCGLLETHGISLLRQGEIEAYVGLGHASKGQYLKAAEEIRAGTRPIFHQQDLERLLNALQAWAAPPAVAAAGV